MISPEGTITESWFFNDLINGQGRVIQIDGEIFEGLFKDGLKTGYGTITW